MDKITALDEVMALMRQLSFGDKVLLLEELNSEIEWELRAAELAQARPVRRQRKSRSMDASIYDTRHEDRPTFTYDDMN